MIRNVLHIKNFNWVLSGFSDELSERQKELLESIKLRLSSVCVLFNSIYPNGFSVILRHEETTQDLNITVSIPNSRNSSEDSKLKKAFQELSGVISKNRSNIQELGLGTIIITSKYVISESMPGSDKNGSSVLHLPTNPSWHFDDLLLSDDLTQELNSILSLVENQKLIYDEWGLRKIQPSPKLIINFFGPPGTGKTLAAHAISNKLGKKILEFSYAQIESKYVGEGPKNLRKAFESAETTEAVLFFDEADSLLGKRIENISEGAEQAINSMRSQMLIEIDKFQGVAIFATNLIQNYDFGFDSRLLHVKFDLPSRELREKMLLRFYPDTMPGKNFVDFDKLASLSEGLSGRDVRDVIIIAASELALNQKYTDINKFLKKATLYIKSKRGLVKSIHSNQPKL